jgi:DNA (cytosine-5)-methyltransferase 1
MIGFLNDSLNNFVWPNPIPLTTTMSDVLGGICTKKIGFTLRVGGRGSKYDDRRN